MPPEGTVRDGDGPGYELIETLRFDPQRGLVNLGRHLARLRASADALDFTFRLDAVGDALRAATGGTEALRVRLALSKDGGTAVTTQPYVPSPITVWRLAVAETRLRSTDTLLRHKTSLRQAYDAARAEFEPGRTEDVILLNEKDEVCEGTITTLFADLGIGPLATPPLSCGLLAGVLRGKMLDEGSAVERRLSVRDLTEARAIFVGNSLRGLLRATLVSGS